MIRQAVLLVPSVETALARVAGLPLVRRNALALGRAGARVWVDSDDARVRAALDGVPLEAAAPAEPALELSCDRIYFGDGDTPPCATAAERRAAERRLYAALRKPVDGPVSRWLNRYLSLAVTRRLVDTDVTPNQMTLVATVIGLCGVAVLVASPTWTGVAAGAALVQVQSILDGCDGEIARLKFQASPIGAWLDNVLDDVLNALYGYALGAASAVLLGEPLWRSLGLFAMLAFSVHYAVVYAQLVTVHQTGDPFAFRWWFQKSADLGRELDAGGSGARLGGVLRALARRDVYLLAFLLLALARLPQLAVAWYAILAGAYLVLSIVHVAKGGFAKAAS
jgi:phosphatidylglycerophosphate synthase